MVDQHDTDSAGSSHRRRAHDRKTPPRPPGTFELGDHEEPLTGPSAEVGLPGRKRRVTMIDPTRGPGGVIFHLYRAAQDGDWDTVQRLLGRPMSAEEMETGTLALDTEMRRQCVAALALSGVTKHEMALLFGVSRQTIYNDLAANEKEMATRLFKGRDPLWPVVRFFETCEQLIQMAAAHRNLALIHRVNRDMLAAAVRLGMASPRRVADAMGQIEGGEISPADQRTKRLAGIHDDIEGETDDPRSERRSDEEDGRPRSASDP